MKKITVFFLFLIFWSCSPEKMEWKFEREIDLGDITPIGLTQLNQSIWLADGDNNRLVEIDNSGEIISQKENFERPMHIATDGKNILIPEYGKDQISILGSDNVLSKLLIKDSLDAPAGVDYLDGTYAIADFYNHRILLGKDDQWISFGKEGKKEGEFYYPTDVQITADKVYVADAYNNRVQVFDRNGNFESTFGKEEKINAATGILVSDKAVFVTDFENDRVLVYDLNGQVLQIIHTKVEKPTDLLLVKDKLYITNYKGKSISVFSLQKATE